MTMPPEPPPDFEAQRAQLVRAAQAQLGPHLAGRIDASSIVQEVYLATYAGGPPAQPVKTALLRRRVRNKIVDEIRKLSAAKHGGGQVIHLDQAASLIDPSADDPTPSQEAARHEEKEVLLALFKKLTDKEADVARAYFLESLSFIEVAEKLDMPHGTVASVVKRVKQKLTGRMSAPAERQS